MAFDMDEATQARLLQGFAIKRGLKGQVQDWLRGIKYFESTVPNPKKGADYPSREQPFQTFLWSDFRATPGTAYDFTVIALYGTQAGQFRRSAIRLNSRSAPNSRKKATITAFGSTASITASHASETESTTRNPDAMTNNVSTDGKLLQASGTMAIARP